MPYQLPGGRIVDIDPSQGGQGIPSNILAGHPSGWSPAYGAAPDIYNPLASQREAIGGDLSVLPDLFTLGNAYNQFNNDQRLGQIMGTPGWGNVSSNQKGILNQDVVNMLAQKGAERGIGTGGAFDSPNNTAAYLRSLGLTSLDLQKLGQEQFNSLLGHFGAAAPFDIASFLVGPEAQQAAHTAANVSAAAPNPAAAAKAEEDALMRAIAAGKAQGGAGGPAGGGIDINKLIEGFRSSQGGTGAVPVGTGSGVNRGTSYYDPGVSSLPPAYRPQVPPLGGRPNDAIQNAFNPPNYSDVGMLGGVGLDPVLNSMLGNGGIWGHLGLGPGGAAPQPDQGYTQDYFGSPSYEDTSMLGGVGLDPTLNALFGGQGDIFSNMGGPTVANANQNDWWNDPEMLFPYESPSYGSNSIDDLFGSNDTNIPDWRMLLEDSEA